MEQTKTTNLPSLLAYTTTPELPKSGRTTSRVLQQPGGKSSFQLGWEDSPKKKTDKPKEDVKALDSTRGITTVENNGTNLDVYAEANVTGTTKDVKVEANGKSGVSVSSNAFASGSAQESPR